MKDKCAFELSGPKMAIVASRDALATKLANRLGDKKCARQGKAASRQTFRH